jgi:hypothetical protein
VSWRTHRLTVSPEERMFLQKLATTYKSHGVTTQKNNNDSLQILIIQVQQILSMLNLLDITSVFHFTDMFVTADLQILHNHYVGILSITFT